MFVVNIIMLITKLYMIIYVDTNIVSLLHVHTKKHVQGKKR